MHVRTRMNMYDARMCMCVTRVTAPNVVHISISEHASVLAEGLGFFGTTPCNCTLAVTNREVQAVGQPTRTFSASDIVTVR